MEVISTKSRLFLSQHKYIRDLLSKTNMIGAKDVLTPLSTTTSLKLVYGTSSTNSTEFRSVIGALQYLSLTRLDISFSVNKLSQFMHKPTVTHWTAAKRLLRYLKHTIFHWLHIRKKIQLWTHYIFWCGLGGQLWWSDLHLRIYLISWCQSYLLEFKEAKGSGTFIHWSRI